MSGWWTGWGWGRWPFPFFLPWPWLLFQLFVGAFYNLLEISFSFLCLLSFISLTCWGSIWVLWYPLCRPIIWVISSFIIFMSCLITGINYGENNNQIMLICMQRHITFQNFWHNLLYRIYVIRSYLQWSACCKSSAVPIREKCRKRIEDWAPRWLSGSSLENSTLPQVIFFLKISLKFIM